jgi:hypothetical protein
MHLMPKVRCNKARRAIAGAILCAMIAAGCGYRVRSSVRTLPEGIGSLGIPAFVNHTSEFRLEQRITSAVIREFSTRTRMPVRPSVSGVDAILAGEIRQISSVPVTFESDTFGSAFLVTVYLSVKLIRTTDSSVIWENPDLVFRERYVLNREVRDFFSEEHPALDRMAREFAAALASTVLSR